MKKLLLLTGLLAALFLQVQAAQKHHQEKPFLATEAFENIPLTLPLGNSDELEAGHLAMAAIESAFKEFIAKASLSSQLSDQEREDLKNLVSFFDLTSNYLNFVKKMENHYTTIADTLNPYLPELKINLQNEISRRFKGSLVVIKDKLVTENLETIRKNLDNNFSLVSSNHGLELQTEGKTALLNLGQSMTAQQMKSFAGTAKILIPLVESLFDPITHKKEISQDTHTSLFYLRQAIISRLKSLEFIGHFFTKDSTAKPTGLFTLYELDKKYGKSLLSLIVAQFESLLKHPDTTAPVIEKIQGLIAEFRAKKTLLSSEIIRELKLHGVNVSAIEQLHNCNDGKDHSKHPDYCPCKKAAAHQPNVATSKSK